jgi:hypothetical protein
MTEASAADLAVVIVNYETGASLEHCLRSLEGARGDVSVDVVVIDNASGDGSADVSEALGARLIRNDTNRYLSPAWNQGAAVTQTPYLLFLNPDTEWFHGTLADLVGAARRHPRAGIVGPMLRNPDGTVYPSGRRFPSLVDAIGHAFLSPFTRNNPFTRRYEIDGWDRSTEREIRLGERRRDADPARRVRRGRRLRRGVPALRRGARHRHATPGARPVCAVHAGGGGDPRRGRLDRWRSPSPPARGDAFAVPVPLLREAPGARLASRNLASGLARPPHPRGARMADREVQRVKAVDATCNMHGDEIIFEYQAVTIILQTLPGTG